MRRTYRERRDVLLRFLDNDLGRWLSPIPSYYGMHVTALGDDLDCEALATGLSKQGVQAHSLQRYHLGPAIRSGLIFGYGTADRTGIGIAMERLTRLVNRPSS